MRESRYTCLCAFLFFIALNAPAQSFSFEDIKSYPFPTELTSAATGSRIAWAFDEQGKRNVYVAEGPEFTPRKLTNYNSDDGQEITSLSISNDGKWVVFVRGGDHGSNYNMDVAVNPSSSTAQTRIQVWSVPFAGGTAKALAEGDDPAVAPNGNDVAFIKNGQVWLSPIDGSKAAKMLFYSKGTNGSLQWSPDGSRLAFVSGRTDHSIIGIYADSSTPVKWIAPSFYRDRTPRWSPDGSKIVFARTLGVGGRPDSILVRQRQQWSLWTADATTGEGSQIWKAPATMAGSVPTTHGGVNLHWAANNRIVFLSYQDGWPHLYSISSTGGTPILLTPGSFMAEHIQLSHDGKWLVFAGNTGPDKLDIDRRHVVRVPVDKAEMEVLTPGSGMEWSPVVTGDGSSVAMISTTPQRPPLPALMSFDKGPLKLLAQNLVPQSFPQNLITPKQVIYTSPDGVKVHAQLFEPVGGAEKKPAIIYVHGGPPRQMLLGWNYSDYYANAYATNQYLANMGFIVLSVNYRLGIGYGYDFHQPKRGAGEDGASEYRDVRAGGLWLAGQANVDASRIGIYGGSYGGFLTALALGRDSKLFAAGVDIHGVHDFTAEGRGPARNDRYEKAPDTELAKKVAWQSSPVAYVNTWKSPVLIIHADDDRNVPFNQSTDLVRRLEAQSVPFETMVIVDDTHHWMKHSNAVKLGNATANFLKRKLMK
jgi:dipeptidyl aminopeptidase/acylaminoacyl peptidase